MLIWLAACAAPAPIHWEVTAVRWAESEAVPVEKLVPGLPGTVDMVWSMFVVRGGGHTILVDAGAADMAPYAAAWNVKAWRSPPEALAELGITPDAVTDLILTHNHWDHAGGARFFPAAKRWSPDRLLPGITVLERGQHVPGHRVVRVTCASRTVVIAGDGIYLYANLEQHLPISVTTDPVANVAEMAALAAEAELLPNHDPALYTRYPAVGPHAVRICTGDAPGSSEAPPLTR